MLERFVAEVVRERSGEQWCAHGVQVAKDVAENLEIDVVGVLDDRSRRPVLLLGSCKRNPDRHDWRKTLKEFDRLVAAVSPLPDDLKAEYGWPTVDLENRGETRPWPGRAMDSRRHLVVSPHFRPDGKRAELEAAGFHCVGIRDMARELGIDPGSCAEAEVPVVEASFLSSLAPAPDNVREP